MAESVCPVLLVSPVCPCGSRTHCEYGAFVTLDELWRKHIDLSGRKPLLVFAVQAADEWLRTNPENHPDRLEYSLARMKSQAELLQIGVELESITFHMKALLNTQSS